LIYRDNKRIQIESDGKATQMIEFKDRDELEDIKGKVNSFFKTNDKKKKKRS
jgi:hypothetical protein